MEEQLAKDFEKGLIDLDSKIPTFSNNDKALLCIKEFISNANIDKLCLLDVNKVMQKYLVEYIKKTSNYSFKSFENGFIGVNNHQNSFIDFLRKSVSLTINSTTDVYEGELTDNKIFKNELGAVENIEISLKTIKGTKTIKLSSVYYEIVSNINIGDYMYIEPNVGILKRIGRCETRANEYDLEGDKYVQLPKSMVHTLKEKETVLSLYDLDFAFNNYTDNITDFTRNLVDKTVEDYLSKGIAKFNSSLIYIEELGHLTNNNFYEIDYMIEKVKNLKIFGFYNNKVSPCAFNSLGHINDFFSIKNINNESISKVVDYFSNKQLEQGLKDAVLSAISYENFFKVLSILELSETAQEFLEIHKSQCI